MCGGVSPAGKEKKFSGALAAEDGGKVDSPQFFFFAQAVCGEIAVCSTSNYSSSGRALQMKANGFVQRYRVKRLEGGARWGDERRFSTPLAFPRPD